MARIDQCSMIDKYDGIDQWVGLHQWLSIYHLFWKNLLGKIDQ